MIHLDKNKKSSKKIIKNQIKDDNKTSEKKSVKTKLFELYKSSNINSDTDTESESDSDSEIDIDKQSISNDDLEDIENNGIEDAVNPLTQFDSKELCYYKTIHKFYKKCSDKEIIRMLDIINGESMISLRVLDWFATRYSRRKFDFFDKNENTVDSFDVHISYKSELKSYKKDYFDPFRRSGKFYYPLYLNKLYYVNKDGCNNKIIHEDNNENNNINNKIDKTNKKKDNDKDIIKDKATTEANRQLILLYTTLGQLNFFKWAITNNIIDYVEKNLDTIAKAMNLTNKDEKNKSSNKKTKKSSQSKKDKSTKDKSPKDKSIKDKSEKVKNKIKINKKIYDDSSDDDNNLLNILDFD
jgi:hypothetical protein